MFRRFTNPLAGRLAHLSSLVVVLGVLLSGGVAVAAKPTVAILGLEVIDDGSGIEPKTTQFAKELTEELRKRPKSGTGPYALAPGSNDKDLLELKLLSGCESEGKDCMAQIGDDLATDRLLYGKVQKQSDGYQVSLKLLNVSTKSFEKSVSQVVPFGEATGANLTSWGKKLYGKLTGVGDQGSLAIRANVDRGTVYLDGQVKGNLSNGAAQIAGLSEGKYKLTIKAEGHLLYEANIEISGGGETAHQAELEKNDAVGGGKKGDGTGPGGGTITSGTISDEGRPGGGARALFWTSLVVTAGSAAAVTVFGMKVRGPDEEAKDDAITAWQNAEMSELDLEDACGDAEGRLGDGTTGNQALLGDVVDACDAGKRDALLTNVFIGTTAVAAVAAVYFYYKGFVASKSSSEVANRSVSRDGKKKKAKKNPVVVLPSVGPTQVGAGVRIEF